MKTIISNKVWRLLMLVIVSALSFAVIPAWVPFLRKEWLLLVTAFIAIVIYRPRLLLKGHFLAIWIVYCFAVFFRVVMGSSMFSNFSIAIYEMLLVFVAIFLPLTIISINSQNFIKNLLLATFFFLIVDIIGSYFLLKEYPSAIRGMHTLIKEEGASAGYDLYRFGLADYGFCHGLPILLPPLFYLFKTTLILILYTAIFNIF